MPSFLPNGRSIFSEALIIRADLRLVTLQMGVFGFEQVFPNHQIDKSCDIQSAYQLSYYHKNGMLIL